MYLHPSLVKDLPDTRLAEILEAFPAGLELTPERVNLMLVDKVEVVGMAGMLLHPDQFVAFVQGFAGAVDSMAAGDKGNSVGHLFCDLAKQSETRLWVGMPIHFDYEFTPVPEVNQYSIGRVVPIMRNDPEFPGVFLPVAYYAVLWSTPHRVGGRIIQIASDL